MKMSQLNEVIICHRQQPKHAINVYIQIIQSRQQPMPNKAQVLHVPQFPAVWVLLLLLLPMGSCFNLEILEPDVLQPMIFVNGKLSDYYNASVYEQNFVCTNGELEIIEFEESPNEEFIVFRYSGAELKRQDIRIEVEPNLEPKPFISDFNRIYKKFTINAACPDIITKQNYYNRIRVWLTIHQQQAKRKLQSKYQRRTTPTTYQFSFLLNCDLWDVHKHFQYGYIFISIICITIVVFVSLHPRICSLTYKKKPINFQIQWQYFLVLTVTMLAGLGSIYLDRHGGGEGVFDVGVYFGNRGKGEDKFRLANGVLKHLGLLASLFYVFVCCSQMIFQWGWLVTWVPIAGSRFSFRGEPVSKRTVVSAVVSVICYLFGLFYQNWVYYNMLSFCIAIGAIKMFRFRSLKNGVYTMVIALSSILLFTIWSYWKLPRSVNDYASQLSSPLFVQVPDLVNNLYKKCSWISIYDMILPGAILAYLRDYDENYHIGWKGVYTFFSILVFSLSCIAWIVVQALIQYNIPFCIVIYPPFISSILLLAIYRNQFQTIWNGYFHFTNDHSINQMIDQYTAKPSLLHPQMGHLFPKDVLDAIKNQESRWSDSQSMQMASHRRAIDDNQVQVWSAAIGKTESSKDSRSEGRLLKTDKTGFISFGNLPADGQRKKTGDMDGNGSFGRVVKRGSLFLEADKAKKTPPIVKDDSVTKDTKDE